MRIGIEGQRLFRLKKHGMDIVALELIKNLQEIDKVNEYFIFVKPDVDDQALKETPNFKIIPLEGRNYPFWEQIVLPRAAKKYGCDILHCTSNTAPLYSEVPILTTLHDIIYLEKSYSQILKGSATPYQKFGNVYRKLVVPQILKKSVKVITVSNFEKRRISDFFNLKEKNNLSAVYNGVGAHFQFIRDQKILKDIKNKYGLPDLFFFFLGNTDPKKNTKRTLKAYSDFRKNYTSDHKLVMLDYDLEELKRILSEIGDPELINQIILTGYVKNEDLPAIYSLSSIFLYPSLRESFGIPILEAMSCGVPVITSNTSSMPEISGNAGCLVDPENPTQIKDAMIRIVKDKEIRQDLVNKGFKQSKKFSWRMMAESVFAEYNDVYHTQKKIEL